MKIKPQLRPLPWEQQPCVYAWVLREPPRREPQWPQQPQLQELLLQREPLQLTLPSWQPCGCAPYGASQPSPHHLKRQPHHPSQPYAQQDPRR